MASAASTIKCAEIVACKKKNFNVIVVVSAVSSITDRLIEIIKLAKKCKPRLVKSRVLEISKIHKEILKNLVLNEEMQESIWQQKFEPIISKLEAISYGTSLVGDLTNKTIARICAFGEKLSSILMVLALEKMSLKAEIIESERVIKTDNDYLKAKVNFQATSLSSKKVLKPIYNGGVIPVITGFIGKDTHGNITLLGRGGSDYTASILAMVLDAYDIEIWTDVDGVMTADPKIVKNAYSWHSIDMNVMSEMAYSGAKVIHPDTIAPAVEKNIPVYVYNTFNLSFQGTKIIKKAPYAKGIVSSSNNTLITLANTSIINGVGFVKKVTTLVAEYNISIDVCATSEISFTFSIKREDYSKKLLKTFETFAHVSVIHNVTKLCFIGNEITNDKKILPGIFQICVEQGVKIHTVSVSASGNNITIIIDEDSAHLILNCLHDRFLI